MSTDDVPAMCHGPSLELTDADPRDAVTAMLRAARTASRAGVATPGGLRTYPELLARARRILSGLHTHGLGPGDHAVLLGLPLAEFFPAFWACLLGGIRPVAIADGCAGDGPVLDRLSHTWRLLDHPLVLTDGPGVVGLSTVVDRFGGGPRVADVDDLARCAAADQPHRPDPDAVALLMLSSGSTGPAKAAELTHRALAEFCAGARRSAEVRPGDVTLNWLPVDHSGALLLYHVLAVFVGCTNVHLDTASVVADPLRWLDKLAEHEATHAWAPTFGLQLVVDALRDRPDRSWDLSAVRSLVCGGEQVLLPVVERFFTATEPFGLRSECFAPVWGMAETTTAITMGHLRSPGGVVRVRKSSLDGQLRLADPGTPEADCATFVAVGPPAPGATIRIVDSADRVLPERRIGRLQIRSARVTKGYANDPDATRQALPDGRWLRTGDLAFISGGQLVITGRERDLIILNGHNVLCHEVEEVASGVDGVTAGRVGACGVSNPDTGSEDLVVFFETGTAEPATTARAVQEALFGRLRLVAARVVPVPAGEFPTTGSGKVQRAELRRRLLDGRYDTPHGTPHDTPDVARVVRDAVREAVGDRVDGVVDDDRPFYELGLNSVRLTRLRAHLAQRLGIDIPATTLFEHPTVAALTARLRGSAHVRAAEPVPSAADNRIAIIGMAARLPGADDVEEFWANLRDGVDSVRVFDRSADPDVVPVGGVLADADAFDPEFFGMSPREAETTDPAHRLFLECCHRALEHGGYAGPAGERIGIYAGSGMNLYGHQDTLASPDRPADVPAAMQATIGTAPDFLATRVAYRLGLTGPAINVQTACSTSLVAVHLAVQALLAGDADLALAGAAAVRMPQDTGYRHYPGSILSPTGRCRPFDTEADGTVGGNGVAAVLLKRLDRALADGDTVHAVILGTAVTNDGTRKVGFTAPSVSGHAEAVSQALDRAGVPADTISYVEAHGTGTPLGDPVEFAALSRVLGSGTSRTGFCTLGSVKPNVGHLDSCAGMAGLIKTVLMIEHGELVPTLNVTRPNAELSIADSPFVLGTEHRVWDTGGRPRRAGVSALGVGGTNAHVVLEEPPPAQAEPPVERPVVLPLSARTSTSLDELARLVSDHLTAHPDLPAADAATTMTLGRPHLPHRLAVVGRTATELAQELTRPPKPAATGPLTFAFSGQGSAHPGMAAQLCRDFPVARRVFDECAEVLGGSLVDSATADRPESAQAVLFAYQAALADVWQSLGIRPDFVVGHSVGEFAAMYTAGALSLSDGARITARRGELMHTVTGEGGMVAVIAELPVAQRIAAEYGAEVAAVNGAGAQVLSGAPDAIGGVVAALDRERIVWRRLAVDRAFHSALVEPALAELRRHAEQIDFTPPRVPLVSTVDGTELTNVDADYLCRQAREPVRFDLALAHLTAAGTNRFLELGPAAVLTGIGRRTVPGSHWYPSRRPKSDVDFWQALADLYRSGANVDWAALRTGRRVPMPGHPFARRRFGQPASTPVRRTDGPLDTVRALTAQLLGKDTADIDPDQSFLGAGADSLALMNLVREIDQTFGIRIAVRRLFEDVDTPAKVVALLGDPVDVAAAPDPETPAAAAAEPAGTREIIDRQLLLAERLMDRVTDLMSQQLATLGAPVARQPRSQPAQPRRLEPVSAAVRPEPPPAANRSGCDFSLYFFGDYPDHTERDKYRLIIDAAEFADQHGFHSLWLPERHFQSFGALFPNPSVLAAALAARTSRIRLHAGSVVLPLHHPIRVAEEWSVVDNLSGGRIGLCVAGGWHALDFVLAPDVYGQHREEMYARLDTVRRLWSGESITATAGNGDEVEVSLHPAPLQRQPPMFVAVVGNPESYRRAAENDLGVVTNLMTQSIEDMADNIALYRRTRAEHGLDPDAGRVVVLVHTYLGEDLETVRAEAFTPFCDYLRASLSLFGQVTNSLGFQVELDKTPAEDVDFLLAQAYQRYCDSRALIGTPDSCGEVMDGLLAAGVDEVSCFVDFGVPADKVLAGLPVADDLRKRYTRDTSRPLSPAQWRIWFLEQLRTGRNTYLEPKAIRLDGPLDVTALRGAFERVVDRQPALRTVFRVTNGEPRATVRPSMRIECPVVDFPGHPQEEALREITHRTAHEVFDLTDGPLLLARLLRLSKEHHVLFLLAHHIVFDEASTSVFTRDLAAYYRAWPGDPRLPDIQEIAPAATGEDADLAFWQRVLSDAPELRLPADRPRPEVRTGDGASLTHELGADLTDQVARFSRTHRVTAFTALLTALSVTLSRFSGQEDYVIGTGVTGRRAGEEDAIGMFVDTVPLRIDVTGRPTFTELARRLSVSTMDAYAHRGVQFDELVAALNPERDSRVNPLFQVAVEYGTTAAVDFDPPHLGVTLLDLPSDRAPLDLVLYLTRHPGGVRCVVEYDTALFDENTVARFLRHFELVLTESLASPDRRLSETATLSTEDQRLLDDWQGAPADDPTLCLHHLVEQQADLTPDAIALTGDAGELTYRELDLLANGIAQELLALGVSPGDLVAVCLPRGRHLVASLLAVLKCGAGFLPLDPSVPLPRLTFMTTDANVVALLTDPDLPAFAECPTLFVPALDPAAMRPRVTTTPNDLAYCIYTSGSTGRPKGVLVPHRGPVNLVRWHRRRHEPTRTLQWASPTFDAAVYEIFTTLAAGAALVLIEDETRYDLAAVAETIRRHEVERIVMPFTPLSHLLRTPLKLPSLREIISGGEPTTPGTAVHDFLAAHPDCVLYNAYGPTEASVLVTEHRVLPGETTPPIGRPIDGVRAELLDADRRPVPVGAVGEICLGGLCVADGYVNRPAETAAAFVEPGLYRTGDLGRWRADGALEFLGRRDDQVKISGNRVEPGEVRHALLELPGVTEAAVVARDGELVAYVIADRDGTALVRLLRDVLPSSHIPHHWVRLDRLPLTAGGKLDRSRLPDPGANDSPAPPVTSTQRTLHSLWCQELGRPEIGINQSFFELGGHSLTAVRLLDKVHTATGGHLTMTDFFRHPTIRDMAAKLEVTDEAPLTFAQRRLWRRHHTRTDPAVYNGLYRVDIEGELDLGRLRDAFETVVNRHTALRTRVFESHQEVMAPFPVELAVVDMPDDDAQIERWCHAQARSAFDLSSAPLWRVRLGRTTPRNWVLAMVFHHMVFDGWSARLLWQELSDLYGGTELPAPTAQYTDYARWEHDTLTGPERQRLETFWRTELAGAALRPNLPYDHPRPAALSGNGALHRAVLAPELAERIRCTAATAGCTPYVVIAAAFARWLGRLCHQDEVVLPTSSARRVHPEHTDVLGYVGEAVLVRVRLDEDPLPETATRLYAALDHQMLPLSEVVGAAFPDEADSPFPAVLFTVVTAAPPTLAIADAHVQTRGISVPGLARTELYTLFTITDEVFTVDIEYATDLFEPSTIAAWVEGIEATLTEVTA